MHHDNEKAYTLSEATYELNTLNKRPHMKWWTAHFLMLWHCFWKDWFLINKSHTIIKYVSNGGAIYYCCSSCDYTPSPAKCICCDNVISNKIYGTRLDPGYQIYYHFHFDKDCPRVILGQNHEK